jgi:hypothetical protein
MPARCLPREGYQTQFSLALELLEFLGVAVLELGLAFE